MPIVNSGMGSGVVVNLIKDLEGLASGAVYSSQHANFNAAVVAATGKALVINSSTTLTATLTSLPCSSLSVTSDGLINLGGFDLTVDKPFQAGIYQCFAGAGSVTGLKESRPEWFGSAGDDSSIDTDSLQKAVNAASKLILSRQYKTATLTVSKPMEIIGENNASVRLATGGNDAKGIFYFNSGSSSSQIDNIIIQNLIFRGESDTPPAWVQADDQYKHLLHLSGVKNAIIQNCQFIGYQGDGVYLGSGEAGEERHNSNVKITNNHFDGVNKNNRNGISIIDANGLIISGNTFTNSTYSNQPGPVDIEPNANIWHVIQNIVINNNTFINNGGSATLNGNINIGLQNAVFTLTPNNISIVGNTITAPGVSGIAVVSNTTDRTALYNITISGNTINAANPINCTTGILNGIVVSNNTLISTGVNQFGSATASIVRDVVVTNNLIKGSGSIGLVFRGSKNVTISNNIIDGHTTAGIRFGAGAITVVTESVSITGNTFTNLGTGKTVTYVAGGLYLSYGFIFKDNITNGYTHDLPAWRTDNTGGNVAANSGTALSIVSTTNATTTVTSAGLFGSVTVGMRIYGAGIPANAYVTTVTDASNIVISVATTASATVTLGFSSYFIFNFQELPDAFPSGISTVLVNGNTTGGPAGTGADQGILTTHRMTVSSGYEKWTYQTYAHANNALKLGSTWIRRRAATTNSWEAWTEK